VSVGLLFLLLVVITLWQSFEIVDAYEKKDTHGVRRVPEA